MKHLILLHTLLAVFTLHLAAGPLPHKQVSAEAKWLIHVDLDAFHATTLGKFIDKQFLETKLQGKLKELEAGLNVQLDLDVQKLKSITAYGTTYEDEPDSNGVLLVHTGQNIDQKIAHLNDQLSKREGSPIPLKKLQQDPCVLYCLGDELFATTYEDQLLLLSKSKQQLEKAREVLGGQKANLAAKNAFGGYPEEPKAFVFLAVAEGFSADAEIPPQAQVLKMADGARLIFGEKSENLFLNLALKAKTAEVASQIHQVVQGLVALVSLSQHENPDLAKLAQSIKVTPKDNLVSIDAHYPVAQVIEKLAEALPKDGEAGGASGEPGKKDAKHKDHDANAPAKVPNSR